MSLSQRLCWAKRSLIWLIRRRRLMKLINLSFPLCPALVHLPCLCWHHFISSIDLYTRQFIAVQKCGFSDPIWISAFVQSCPPFTDRNEWVPRPLKFTASVTVPDCPGPERYALVNLPLFSILFIVLWFKKKMIATT